MQVQIQSDGQTSQTRVVLVTDRNERIDVTSSVCGVTWHLDCGGGPARVLLQIEGEVSATVAGLLELATTEQIEAREAMQRMLEVPG